MYRGFNVGFVPQKDEDFRAFLQVGLERYKETEQLVQFNMGTFLSSQQNLDGKAIQDFWFPQVNADIFISHSHQDQDSALALSGWLWSQFKLNVFIDSMVWGFGDDLLRALDNEYCYNEVRKVYDYGMRNRSTAHVHMMLSAALTMMMDKTECIFFMNTPNSIQPFDGSVATNSPWIYSELAQTKVLQTNPPKRLRLLEETFSNFTGEPFNKALPIAYKTDLAHLTPITIQDLMSWPHKQRGDEHALDTLYRLKPVTKK